MAEKPEGPPGSSVPAAAMASTSLAEPAPEQHEPEALEVRRDRDRLLQEYRRWLIGVDHESSVSFDKVLVTLSAGALGISVSQARARALWLWSLELAWALFTVSLLAMLLSYLTARRDLRRAIADTDWKLVHGEAEAMPEEWRAWHEVKTTTLNQAALVCLVVGICFLVAYAARNLG